MSRCFLSAGFVLAAFLWALPATGQLVIVCPISGMIDEGVLVVIERAVQEARESGADALVFRVDTPGGRVDSAVSIATAIGEASCLTIAYVTGMGAVSAGALISYACDEIVMTPGSVMGDAQPVIPSGQGMMPTGEKEVSFVRNKMRALAEANGKNPDLAAAMVDKDIELYGRMDEDGQYEIFVSRNPTVATAAPDASESGTPSSVAEMLRELLKNVTGSAPPPIDGPVAPASQPEPRPSGEEASSVQTARSVLEEGNELIIARGKLLTMTHNDALKYGVIPVVVENMDEALAYFDLEDAEIRMIEPNWAEGFFRWVTGPTVAGLLLMLGMGGLYFEVKTPGFGVPGIIAAVCLALFFGSHYILGLTDVIDILLVLVGVILILLEVFVFPGFGIAGVAGLFCLVIGLYLSLLDFTWPEYSWHFERLREVAHSFTVAIVTFAFFVYATWRFLPHTPLYSRFVLTTALTAEEGFVVQTEEDSDAAVGLKGSATSMLRPAGRGRFGKKTYMVVSRGEFIEDGAPIEIVQVDGNRYVVDRLQERDA